VVQEWEEVGTYNSQESEK